MISMIKTIFASLLFFSFSGHAGTFIPEASGATKVGDKLIISGDEEPSSLWVSTPGTFVMEKVKVSGGKWDDLESLATINQGKFFGMTSHSLTKKGKRKPEREQLMVFEMANGKISIQKSFTIRDQILSYLEKNFSADLNMNEVQSGTPDGGGLNVEGMAYFSGKLYFGLRSPLTKKGEAILLVVSDPESNTSVTSAMKLNLFGNGIRGLESSGDQLLILTGSTDDTDKEFGLHQLNPKTAVMSSIQYAGFSRLLRPESLVVNSQDSLIFVQDFESGETQETLVELRQE